MRGGNTVPIDPQDGYQKEIPSFPHVEKGKILESFLKANEYSGLKLHGTMQVHT